MRGRSAPPPRPIPDFLGDFLHQGELGPLLLFGELVADLARGEAALGAQVEAVERHVAGGFVDAYDHGVLVFRLGALGDDQAERMELGYLYRPHRPLTPLAQRYLELMKADVAPWRDEPAAAR